MRYVILLLGIAFSVVGTAAADPITLTVEGTLNSVSPGCCHVLPFALGDPFRVAITFNQPTSNEITVVPADPEHGRTYTTSSWGARGGSVSATLGDTRLSGSALLSGGVFDDISDDSLNLYVSASGADPDTQGFDYIISGMGQWLSTAEWPTDLAAAFRMAPQNEVVIADFQGETPLARGPITQITQTPAAPTPEPTTLLMLGTGVAAIVGARKWRQPKA